jgi:hypothetical protein
MKLFSDVTPTYIQQSLVNTTISQDKQQHSPDFSAQQGLKKSVTSNEIHFQYQTPI